MILIDFSQVCLSNIFVFQKDIIRHLKDEKPEEAVNIIRHTVLSSIKFYKKKYSKDYGKIVIACDGRNYWRKEKFAYYKAGRAESREKSELDWGFVFDTLSRIREDLEKYFPYKIVQIERGEADDVIAVLTKWAQTNELSSEGLYDSPQNILIVSSDNDFKQLHKYKGVRQWSPQQKKFVECKNPYDYLNQHIAKAGDDGIPNVLSNDNVFVEKIRQTSLMAGRLEKFITEGRDACLNETEKRNWDRNNLLINFEMIPEDITKSVIDTYTNMQILGDKMSVMQYLIKNRCRLLLDELEDF